MTEQEKIRKFIGMLYTQHADTESKRKYNSLIAELIQLLDKCQNDNTDLDEGEFDSITEIRRYLNKAYHTLRANERGVIENIINKHNGSNTEIKEIAGNTEVRADFNGAKMLLRIYNHEPKTTVQMFINGGEQAYPETWLHNDASRIAVALDDYLDEVVPKSPLEFPEVNHIKSCHELTGPQIYDMWKNTPEGRDAPERDTNWFDKVETLLPIEYDHSLPGFDDPLTDLYFDIFAKYSEDEYAETIREGIPESKRADFFNEVAQKVNEFAKNPKKNWVKKKN